MTVDVKFVKFVDFVNGEVVHYNNIENPNYNIYQTVFLTGDFYVIREIKCDVKDKIITVCIEKITR